MRQVARTRELGSKQGIASSLSNLGDLALTQSDYAAAGSLLKESLALYRELADKRGIAISLNNLANVAYEQGEYTAARSLLEESLILAQELGDRLGIAACLAVLAGAEARLGQMERSAHEEVAPAGQEQGIADDGSSVEPAPAGTRVARLLGASQALLAAIGGLLGPGERRIYDEATSIALELLGEEFQPAWQQGRAMSSEQALAYASEFRA